MLSFVDKQVEVQKKTRFQLHCRHQYEKCKWLLYNFIALFTMRSRCIADASTNVRLCGKALLEQPCTRASAYSYTGGLLLQVVL